GVMSHLVARRTAEIGSRMTPGARPADPLTLAAVAALLLASGLAACLIPARRAMRVDPVEALRQP
ncbi:MAG TPA: hypothetical protein VLD67_18470, partial [Vicinamibacterales bacterium]|nr:hypothetical protein [Vicinamibacterales bacterium]